MDYILYAIIGIAAGFLGGLLGIGGGVIVIPALVLLASMRGRFNGSYQHLIQAAAMICNFCISLPSAIGHWHSGAVIKKVITGLIPSAFFGVIFGVFLSNTSLFAGDNGKYLLIILCAFMIYVSIYNTLEIVRPSRAKNIITPDYDKINPLSAVLTGFLIGLQSGLLGVGGGALSVPAQQIFLKIPLKNAIANSACVVLSTILIGAVYKNVTLAEHGHSCIEAAKIAGCIIPTAMIASFFGSKVTHNVNTIYLRIVYIVFMIIVSITLLNKVINS